MEWVEWWNAQRTKIQGRAKGQNPKSQNPNPNKSKEEKRHETVISDFRWRDRGGFGCEGLQHCGGVSEVLEFRLVPFFSGLLSQNVGGGDGWKSRWNGRFGQGRIGRRVAVEPLVFDRRNFFCFFDAGRIVLVAKGAAGVVALFLGHGDLAVKPD